VTTDRKLEEIVSNLDDMSETIEEIKDQKGGASDATDKLDSLQGEMTRATDLIEEALESESTDRPE
jgi:hypothetical protein